MISKDVLIKSFTMIFNKIDFSDKSMLPSEFAEKYISLDSSISSLKQGKFSYKLTPYLREVADCASPYHPSKLIAVMKGAQLGFSQGVIVPALLWKIANDPGNIVSLSANDGLSKDFVEKRIDPIIQRTFIRDLIRPSAIKKGNQRTGDTSDSKEFAGGSAVFGGLQSYDKLGKQRSFALGFFDDWDAAKVADKEQGNTFELIEQRFSTAANNMKMYFISTPETRPSNIELMYLMGDQRKWNVPCPCCGEFIELKWFEKDEEGDFVGVIFDKNPDGTLIEDSVRYRCQKCKGEFKEKHKYEMNLHGVWIPTATPIRPGYYSYHIPCMIAAPGMFSWTDYAYKWLRCFDTNGNVIKANLKTFKNVVLGEAWEETRVTLNANDLNEHTREYEIGIVPSELSVKDGNEQIIMLTLACDMNGTENDARLDWQLIGHSISGSIYSVSHGSIGTYERGKKSQEAKELGHRDLWTYRLDEHNNVWSYLETNVLKRHWTVDDGRQMQVMFCCIDSGYNPMFAYQFVERHEGLCVAIKGKDKDKYIKPTQDIRPFKLSTEKPYLYLLDVNKYKDIFSDMVELTWDKDSGIEQPQGYVNFPMPNYQDNKYTIDFFKELSAEEKELHISEVTGEVDGWRWKKKKSDIANHHLDTMIYNLSARDIFVYNFFKEYNKNKNEKVDATWHNFSLIVKGML